LLRELVRWVRPWHAYHRRVRRRTGRARDLAAIRATDGELSSDEATLLYDLARAAAGGCIVEIGTFHGKSTVACALGTRAGQNARVYAVDPFLPFTGVCGGRFGPADKTVLLRNLLLADVGEQVWLLHTTSVQAARGWSERVALLWIDGDHSYEAVQADVQAWMPFVIPGGVVAFHDARNPALGPYRVTEELLAGGDFERAGGVGSISVLRRRG
jgi:predicted O-methyltransferase YrrM